MNNATGYHLEPVMQITTGEPHYAATLLYEWMKFDLIIANLTICFHLGAIFLNTFWRDRVLIQPQLQLHFSLKINAHQKLLVKRNKNYLRSHQTWPLKSKLLILLGVNDMNYGSFTAHKIKFPKIKEYSPQRLRSFQSPNTFWWSQWSQHCQALATYDQKFQSLQIPWNWISLIDFLPRSELIQASYQHRQYNYGWLYFCLECADTEQL